jgi:capsular exopolysaccharide synthesis family protein
VNAVVDAFTERTKSFGTATAKLLKADYEEYLKNLKKEIDDKKERLTALAKKGNVEYQRPMLILQAGDNEQFSQPPVDSLSLDQYKLAKNEFMQTEFQLVELEARLAAKQAEMQQSESGADRDSMIANEQNNKQLKEQIADEFRHDPDVAALISQIKATKEQVEHNRGVAKKDFDPSLFAAQKQLKRLTDEYNDLWRSKSEQIKQRLLVPTGATGSPNSETIAELKIKIESLKIKRAKYSELLSKFDAEKQLSQVDTLNSSFHQADLVQLYGMYDLVNKKLKQLDFSKDKSAIYIEETDRAEVPKAPYNNKRIKYMAFLPLVLLFAVVGVFLLLEVRSERVGDPDLLSNRVRSEVYALPPLPTSESARKLSGPAVDDQIDRFIQRLDHLRFAVCGSQHDAELGRCLLVTSAISGEGKTTLAAQLAARCGNAGVSTLLIDADLRRAGMCSLLDIPEGPGLSDLLVKDQTSIEELVIPVQGGSFHLLAAGTPVQDPSGVFQGRGLALLIAELRKRFEMIIIDSPPVLPVPDALILGRWADGALLAARFEVSRSPQVERARRQLDNAGIPLLGTVINGMRSSEEYYGRYTYTRQRPVQPDPSGEL